MKTLIGVLVVGAALAWSMVAVHNSATTRAKVAMVYQVCNESRISPTIDERGCGDLQDQTHTEFLCDANNVLVSNHCWVEVK